MSHSETVTVRNPLSPMPSSEVSRSAQRVARANTPGSGDVYGDNKVVTAKYRCYSFIFVFLYAKFRYELANQYFLLICILQSIKAVSITNGGTSAWA